MEVILGHQSFQVKKSYNLEIIQKIFGNFEKFKILKFSQKFYQNPDGQTPLTQSLKIAILEFRCYLHLKLRVGTQEKYESVIFSGHRNRPIPKLPTR